MILDLLYLSRQWKEIHADEGVKPDWTEFQRVVRAYCTKDRSYHALNHLVYGLKEIDRLADKTVKNRHLVKFSYFYHDVVMIFGAKPEGWTSNERKSAEELVAYAIRAGFHGAHIRVSETLVINTENHFDCTSRSPLWWIMNDADLAVFGADERVYQKYAKGVWKEYSFVGKAAYIANRVKFLESMKDKTIFRLGPASVRSARNALAKKHIRSEIGTLQNSPEFITG